MKHPELLKRCGELRLGPENAPNFCSASGRRDGGSSLQKNIFWYIFRISPFWNPPCIPIYPSYISNPDGCESRESELSESFGHFKIGWKLSVGSFGKRLSLSSQAGPFGILRSLPESSRSQAECPYSGYLHSLKGVRNSPKQAADSLRTFPGVPLMVLKVFHVWKIEFHKNV